MIPMRKQYGYETVRRPQLALRRSFRSFAYCKKEKRSCRTKPKWLNATAPTNSILSDGFKFLVFADDADFRFQVDTVGLFDAFLDFVDDVEDIPGRCVARVDDEAGVFHRDLGIAAG